ncbi:MAG: DMT family transporter [Chloroflexi bacterium]|nr:DMT family transporter [Chloroflexota bacterium]MCL5109720.1 DMT family transporter [Chloroflexota bacterium]
MPLDLLALLLLAALFHASWNLLTKQSNDKDAFIWLTYAAAAVLFSPSLLIYGFDLSARAWLILLGSAAGEVAYCLALARAYSRFDYSLVYPIARGSAPPLIALWSALFLGDSPTLGAGAGVLLVVVGIVAMGRTTSGSTVSGRPGSRTGAVISALAVGLCISTYTTLDKAAMALVAPPPYLSLVLGATAVLLLPWHWRRLDVAAAEWRSNWRRVLAVACLLVCGYSLVLFALQQIQVAYVGAVREVSVVFAALLGWLLLREPFGLKRTAAATLIFAGIAAVARFG